MSTKIYNGVMLNGVYTIQDMYDFVDSLKAPIQEAVYMDRAKEILSTACLIYDMHHVMGQDYFNPDEGERVPLLVASRRHVVLGPDEASDYNIAIGWVDGYVLGMFFFDDRQSEKIFLEHPQVQYFGYWNNTDRDENTSEQEWELRKELWSKMFDRETRSTYPNEAMFINRILSNSYIMPEDRHMNACIPTVEERRDAVVRNVSFALAKKDIEDETDTDDEDKDYSKTLTEIISRAEEKHAVAKQAVPVSKFTEQLTLASLSKAIPNNNKEDEDGSDGIPEVGSED